MAEVLGIIAAVVGVADVGCKLSLSLYRYSHAVAFPGKAIESISSEVSLLSSVLQQLGSCLEEDEFVKLCKAETLTTTKEIAEECKTAFEDLDDIIGKYVESGKMKLRDRLKWPFVQKRVTLLRVNLDRLKSTLMLMLEVLKYARSIVKHDQTPSGADREIIVALQQANVDATWRYEKLLMAIEHGSTTGNDSSAEAAANTNTFCVPPETEVPPPAYNIIDENGIDLTQTKDLFGKDELLSKLKNVSTLIDQVDRAQADIMEMTRRHGIWEMSLTNNGHGSCHFRHTNISKHDRLPEFRVSDERIEGAESSSERKPTQAVLSKTKDAYIAVMGVLGSGKSSFVNLLCGQGTAGVSHNHQKGTEIINLYDFMYTPEVRVHLIDTPGFDDTNLSEGDILEGILRFMHELHIDNIKLSGIIWLHDVWNIRRYGSPRRYLRSFSKLCGDNPAFNVVLVTTNGDVWGETRTRLVENNLIESWRSMIVRGSLLIRHTGDKESAMRIIDSILRLPTKVLLDIQQEIIDQGAKLSETGAGKEVESALRKKREKHERQLKEIEEHFNQALRYYDQEWAEELRRAPDEYRAEISSSARAQRKVYEENLRLRLQLEVAAVASLNQAALARLASDQQQGLADRRLKIISGTRAGSTVNDLLLKYTTVVDDTAVPDKHLYLESGEPGGQHEGGLPAIGN